MAGPALRIAAPTREPRRGGLSDVAEFIQDDTIGNAESVVFQSEGCAFPQLEANRCFVDVVPDKQYGGIEILNAIGQPFTIYAGVRCFAGPEPDHRERAERALAEGRDRVLEDRLALWANGGTALAAGGDVVGAIALVEQELDEKYLGRGILLMSRADAIRADAGGALTAEDDGSIHTVVGTRVLASGSVTPGTIFGLGAISVHHSRTVVTDVIAPRKNLHDALAEAIFAPAVDCEFRVKSSTGA
ncbi:hypothetical protein SEA_FRANSOYER_28 [Microbacterium phage Fransoyer]|nr:hypothetical protein SEA_SADLAD_30 [Microbacterium phage SadLad]UUG69593.1 hypothetical protein SEA_FRANSOYER_28 [Microbacterium phage Fransoyer]